MVRRSAWDKVGGWDAALPESAADVEFCLRLGRAGFRVVHTPEVTATRPGPAAPVEGPVRAQADPYLSGQLAPGPSGWQLTDGNGSGAGAPPPGSTDRAC
jgi:hypothetical protein